MRKWIAIIIGLVVLGIAPSGARTPDGHAYVAADGTLEVFAGNLRAVATGTMIAVSREPSKISVADATGPGVEVLLCQLDGRPTTRGSGWGVCDPRVPTLSYCTTARAHDISDRGFHEGWLYVLVAIRSDRCPGHGSAGTITIR